MYLTVKNLDKSKYIKSISNYRHEDLLNLIMNSTSSLSILNSYYDTIVEDLVTNYSSET
ncbi:unnamed protein product, partial [Rotaria sordida]